MHPIIARILGFEIGAYGVFAVIAVWSAVAVALELGKRSGIGRGVVFGLAFGVVAAGLVGCKLGYACSGLGRGAGLPSRRQGGVIRAGIFAGALARVIQVRWRRLGLFGLGGVAAPGVLLAGAIGRLGCFSAGCCFGSPSEAPWS